MSDVLRILDANLNRAREALRVLEEYARMVLDDAALSERAKVCRHRLVEAAGRFPRAAMLAERDVPGDVGTLISAANEGVRKDALAVAAAAASRATEALRCLEEYGKTVDPDAATQFEHLRYEVYTLEQSMLCAGPRRARLRKAQLHVLITEELCAGPWLDVARAALAGGADVIQLREKTLPDGELLSRAKQLRELTADKEALLAINDRPDIARLCNADIVHVGQDDLPVADARRIAGPTVLVGKSTHGVEQVHSALAEGPDYIAVGPMFESSTKPGSEVKGPGLLEAALGMTELPVVAIGGITAETVVRLGPAGRFQAAVSAAVIGAADPGRASAAFLAILMKGRI